MQVFQALLYCGSLFINMFAFIILILAHLLGTVIHSNWSPPLLFPSWPRSWDPQPSTASAFEEKRQQLGVSEHRWEHGQTPHPPPHPSKTHHPPTDAPSCPTLCLHSEQEGLLIPLQVAQEAQVTAPTNSSQPITASQTQWLTFYTVAQIQTSVHSPVG